MKNDSPKDAESKYNKDLKELDILKEKAKKSKPKKPISPGNFFRLLLTLILLITLFAIAFGIAYRKSVRDSEAISFDYIPEAKIILPTTNP